MGEPSTSQIYDSTAQERALDSAILKIANEQSLNCTSHDPSLKPTFERISIAELKDQVIDRPDITLKPEKKNELPFDRKDIIASSLIQAPIIKRKHLNISTFTPTMFNYYKVIHYMDTLMYDNLYYERSGVIWHPLVTRLYCGFLCYYQTLRAMSYSQLGSSATRQIARQLENDLPPDRLPVPGPLLPILKTICACSPNDPYYLRVSPSIPDIPGPDDIDQIISAHSQMLGMPNLPFLTGLANNIITADPDDIPDYTDKASFSDREAIEVSGYVFNADAWTQQDRNLLCQPGNSETLETTRDLDTQFNELGHQLQLPIIDVATDISHLTEFLMLDNIEWIDTIIPTMSYYSKFFRFSGTLGNCSPFGPTSSLMRSRPINLTSRTAAENIIYIMTEAFPDMYPYQLIYDQRSFELSTPQMYMLTGQYACINTRCDYRGLDAWSQINIPAHGRNGPYWDQHPSNVRIAEDKGFEEIEDIISNHYYVDSPEI